jgi:hypothetical protein
MKLDAEGSELAVLRGAASSLEKLRPALIMEINAVVLEQGGASSSGVAGFLLDRGYSLFRLDFRRLEAWDPANPPAFCEALCLPGERAAGLLKRLEKAGFEWTR